LAQCGGINEVKMTTDDLGEGFSQLFPGVRGHEHRRLKKSASES
jgi:hypothetical protein